jgi:hypothetical protein
VAVSVRETSYFGSQVADFEALSLDEHYVLAPGQEMIVARVLVIPEEKLGVDRQPQRKLALEFSFVLDPIPDAEGKLAPALAGFESIRRTVTRMPLPAGEDDIRDLTRKLETGTASERVTAVHSLMALIMERADMRQGKTPPYAAKIINQDALTQNIVAALKNASPVARARAVLALMRFPLSEDLVNAVAPLLSDSNWLPRLLTVEMLGMKQGPEFLPVLDRIRNDSDTLVKRLAQAYYEEAKSYLATSPKGSTPPTQGAPQR